MPSPGSNAVLTALPAATREQLLAKSRTFPLVLGDVIWQPDDLIIDVLFPTSGLISFVVELETGSGVESATAGREGIGGIEAAMPGGRAPLLSIAQVAGSAIAVPADLFRATLRESPVLATIVARYGRVLLQTAAQSAACNRYHEVEARLARWLLVTQDSVGDRFKLTQEFIAQMLGTYRPSVTLAARRLNLSGLIVYHRGDIQVLDRPGLEEAACECYHTMRARLDNLYTEGGATFD